MHQMSLRFLLCGLALLLYFADVGFSGKVPLHFCHFDEIHKHDDGTLPQTQTLTRAEAKALPRDSVVEDKKSKGVIRFHLSLQDLRIPTKYCKTANSKRADVLGNEITCNQDNILTAEKKRDLVHIVRAAMKMHSNQLKVRAPVEHGFKVPEFANAFCKRFAVPADHRQKGVAGADIALYVSSFPSLADNLFAASAPCAQQSDGRPVAGVLTYATRRIQPTVYNVRVAAHEIAHTLGFAYNVMKNIKALNMNENQSDNGKTNNTRVGNKKINQFIEEQYGCSNGVTQMHLEDEAGVLSVPSRSHWERRVALEDLMAGIVTAGLYTELTLSLFEDMGFYTYKLLNFEFARWGSGAGCDFFQNSCIENGVSKYPQMFCTSESNDNTKSFCAPGHRAMGKCSGTVTDPNVATQHQYFTDNKQKTGHKYLLTDRCPVVEEYEELSCTDSAKGTAATGHKDPNSWCMVGCEEENGKCSKVQEHATCGKATMYDHFNVQVQMQAKTSAMQCSGGHYHYLFVTQNDQKYCCPGSTQVEQAEKAEQIVDDTKKDADRLSLLAEINAETESETLPSANTANDAKFVLTKPPEIFTNSKIYADAKGKTPPADAATKETKKDVYGDAGTKEKEQSNSATGAPSIGVALLVLSLAAALL